MKHLIISLSLAAVANQMLGTVALVIAAIIFRGQMHPTLVFLPLLVIPQLIATCGAAWWLLCQPSPNVSIATQKLFVDVSPVRNLCDPHMCVAEFTSQVECSPKTVRKKNPHSRHDHPPSTNIVSATNPIGIQCHLLIHT